MNGYLMQEQPFARGEDTFLESFSPENRWGVIFEDDGETAYFYAVEKDAEGKGLRVLDALHIYEVEGGGAGRGEGADAAAAGDDAEHAGRSNGKDREMPVKDGKMPGGARSSKLIILWSKDWEKCALVIDGFCHAVYDFKARGGYNINEFPPPNAIWTQGERKLTDELIRGLF